MPVMMIGPEEFAALLEQFGKDLVKDLPVPLDRETALQAAVRLMAFQAIVEKAATFRALERQIEQQKLPLEQRLVPFAHRVPRGTWLS